MILNPVEEIINHYGYNYEDDYPYDNYHLSLYYPSSIDIIVIISGPVDWGLEANMTKEDLWFCLHSDMDIMFTDLIETDRTVSFELGNGYYTYYWDSNESMLSEPPKHVVIEAVYY